MVLTPSNAKLLASNQMIKVAIMKRGYIYILLI